MSPRYDRSPPTEGTSNNERHSGHVDVAMTDPDCNLCNPSAHERSAGAAPLDAQFADLLIALAERNITSRGDLDLRFAHERSAGAAPLDVERLEFALHEHYGEGNDDTCWHSHDAERVARIYERADVYGYVARLASEGTDR